MQGSVSICSNEANKDAKLQTNLHTRDLFLEAASLALFQPQFALAFVAPVNPISDLNHLGSGVF